MRILLAAITIPVALASPILAQDWTTYRGDPQRSGNPGGKPGPSTPRVLWTFKAKEHFIAAPVPTSQGLLVSGLSFINSSVLYHLDTDPKAEKRVLWQKSSPLLELPTVSSPLVRDGEVIFGDGMHQTNGASLQALDLPAGSPRWQLRVDGTLVHLEGAPTLAQGRIYLGGGAAGVLCVDPNRLTLEGKEGSPAEMIKILKQKWTDLQNDFEEKRKKKDPLALPPRDSDLPRPTPALVWNRGKNDWHVDAPLAVVEGKVLVATAFLDKEMVGKRALICLDAATGKELWQTALSINPWGGPSVQGKTVVVTGSTISYDPTQLRGARGMVTAIDLDSGKVKWKKELPGGAVSSAALGKDLAVVTCTDGKVRGYHLLSGALRWTYDAGAPFFAPVALAGDTAYAGDLRGVVHAIHLRSGASQWKLDLARDPRTQSPGMIYGGPVVQGGRLHVATCNLAGEHANQPTAIICIGDN